MRRTRTGERTFAWLGKCRRFSKDREDWVESSETFVRLGMIPWMLNRLKPKNNEPAFGYQMAAESYLWDSFSERK